MSTVAPRTALLGALAVALLGGCAGAQVGPTVPVAGPAHAPATSSAPVGELLGLRSPVSAMLVDPGTGTLAVAAGEPDRLLLLDTGDLRAPPREVALPGPAADLALAAPGGPLLVSVPEPGALLRVGLPGASVHSADVAGQVRSAAVVNGRTVVALGDRVAVLGAGSGVVDTVRGFADAARLVPVGDSVAVLDRAQTSLTLVDPAAADAGAALRAGSGATNAVGDRFGRVLVLDTRGGELLVFSGDPLILRQRYPVAGAPFGLAYDRRRDLAWVTLTARNEVVGFDVAGGEPVERYRFLTVGQPDSVAVDPRSGNVVVGSSSGDGVQLIKPESVVVTQ
ncbi:MAG: hypothetical protein GEV09_05245 [Pseudonocardiaceae bacterium]|nr:hypothetical protein [Pseudonocardiaceae bacterium]